MNNYKNIVLIGMPGSGKTSVSKVLAAKMKKFSLADIDTIIENQENCSINEIFKNKGENYFRILEKCIIKKTAKNPNQIISIGGGAFETSESILNLKKNSVIFYLVADVDTLFNRLSNDTTRPLLQTQNSKRTIENLLQKREKNYLKADFYIDVNNKSIEEISAEITESYNNYLNSCVFIDIPINKNSSYPIIIGNNLLADLPKYIQRYSQAKKYLIISNEHIYSIYKSFMNIENAEILLLQDGEIYKSFESFKLILDKAQQMHLERNDAIIAFGGGVIGDISGFCASVYLRGIDFIQVPTTLLAQTDSAVGGKTAINSDFGKNLIGSFYQPSLVISDVNTLNTLDERQFKTGFAEVLKYAFIEKTAGCNFHFFDFLMQNRTEILNKTPAILAEMIKICCQIKAKVVMQDEKEQGLRAILNFGHTFAHAVEKATDYTQYTHGEAVLIGMKFIFDFALKQSIISEDYYNNATKLIKDFDLKTELDENISQQKLIEIMKFDKKSEQAKIKFIIPKEIGLIEIKLMSAEEVFN